MVYKNGVFSNISDGDTLKYNYLYDGNPSNFYTMDVTITFKLITATPTLTPATATPTLKPATATPTLTPATPTPTLVPATPSPTASNTAIVAPKTGDNMPIAVPITIMIVVALLTVYLVKTKKK